ncbi:MAG: peptidoglycan editing factor PgeF [Azospirillaceae bacterium]
MNVLAAEILTARRLAAQDPIAHGFFTRQGGVSTGIYASRNVGLGSGDDPQAVRENRRRCRADLDPHAPALVTCHQVHSAHAVAVDRPFVGTPPQADGLVTRTPGLMLGILTADCVPVLLADRAAGVIGALHAGWGGALKGIVEATVRAMVSLGAEPDRIESAIGPAIRQRSYEVGAEFRERFVAADPGTADLFVGSVRDGHFQFDLPGFVIRRLKATGVRAVQDTAHDTYADEERFFSYRRSVHRGEPDYGRALSAIVLRR